MCPDDCWRFRQERFPSVTQGSRYLSVLLFFSMAQAQAQDLTQAQAYDQAQDLAQAQTQDLAQASGSHSDSGK